MANIEDEIVEGNSQEESTFDGKTRTLEGEDGRITVYAAEHDPNPNNRAEATLMRRAQELKDNGYVPPPNTHSEQFTFNKEGQKNWYIRPQNIPRTELPQSTFMPTPRPTGAQIGNEDYLEGWDYKTDKQNPNGESLPPGAVGWTPFGRPYYGGQNDLSEWALGVGNRLSDPTNDGIQAREWSEIWGDYNASVSERQKNLIDASEFGQTGEGLGPGIGDQFSGLMTDILGGVGAIAESLYRVGSVTDEQQEKAESGTSNPLELTAYLLKTGGRVIGEMFSGAGAVLEEVLAVKPEQAISTIERTTEFLREDSGLAPRKPPLDDKITGDYLEGLREGGHGRMADIGAFFLGALNSLDSIKHAGSDTGEAVAAYLRSPEHSLSYDDFSTELRKNFDVGRLHYSGWVDSARINDYTARYEEGENPYLLANELMIPMAEMAGRIILDGAGALSMGRKGAQSTRMSQVQQYMTPPSRITEAMSSFKGSSTRSVMGNIEEFNINVLPSYIDDIRTQRVSTMAEGGLFALDESGKINRLTERGGIIISSAAQSTATNGVYNVEAMAEWMRGMSYLVSDDSELRLLGMSYLTNSKVPLTTSLSPAAMEIAIVMNRLEESGDLGKLTHLAQKSETVQDVMDGTNGMLRRATESAFPTVESRLINNADSANPTLAISNTEMMWHRVKQSQQATFKAMGGEVFTNLYLGFSPGYPARNVQVDTLIGFIDSGPGFIKDLKSAYLAPQSLRDNLTAFYGGNFDFAERGIGAADLSKSAKFTAPTIAVAQALEGKSSLAAVHRATVDGFRQLHSPVLTEARDLLQGFSKKQISTLESVYRTSMGDSQKIHDALRKGGEGSFSARWLETGQWADQKTLNTLEDLGMLEPIEKALRADTLEEGGRFIDELFETVDDYGRQIRKEVATIDESAAGFEDFAAIEDAKNTGHFKPDRNSDNIMYGVRNSRAANMEAEMFFESAVDGMSQRAKQANPELYAQIYSEYPKLGEFLDGKTHRAGIADIRNWRNDLIGNLKSFMKADNPDYDGFWRTFNVGEPPVGNTREMTRKAFWELKLLPELRDRYKNLRKVHNAEARDAAMIFGGLDSNGKNPFGIDLVNEPLLIKADEASIRATVWDNMTVSGATGDPYYLTNEAFKNHRAITLLNGRNISKAGRKVGINHVQALRLYNADTGNKVQHLFEVPYEEYKKLIEARAGDTFVDIPADLTPPPKVRRTTPAAPAAAPTSGANMSTRAQVRIDSINDSKKALEAEISEIINTGVAKGERFADDPRFLELEGELNKMNAEATRLEGEMTSLEFSDETISSLGSAADVEKSKGLGMGDDGVLRISSGEASPASTRFIDNMTEDPRFTLNPTGTGKDSGNLVFEDGDALVTIEISQDPNEAKFLNQDVVTLNSIQTPPSARGQGHARQAMEALVTRADENGQNLALQVDAFGTDASKLSDDDLTAWYERLGFHYGEDTGAFMVREAKTTDVVGDIASGTELFSEGTDFFANDHTPYVGSEPPTDHRIFWMARGDLKGIKTHLKDVMERRWSDHTTVLADAGQEQQLLAWERRVAEHTDELKPSIAAYSLETRDYQLHNYGQKRNVNSVLGHAYPWNFWHTETYRKFLKRVAQQPRLLSGYSIYSQALDREHAGQAPWWRQNWNTNELFGRDDASPLNFNLMTNLNPINGLTGTDFNDKNKITGPFTEALDSMNKFGPSTSPMLSILTALSLYSQGEKDAARRWGGRLFPFSKAIRAAQVKMGSEKLFKDPITMMFSDGKGTDPYEEDRIYKQLVYLIEQEEITPEQAVDASEFQEGEIWDRAVRMDIGQRGWGDIASYTLGAGFKPRTATDVEVSQFWGDYIRLLSGLEDMKPEEIPLAYEALEDAYPMMTTLLLSRRDGIARDISYTYAILSRVPPGQTEVFESAGLNREQVDDFYATGGKAMDGWTRNDKDRFMSAISTISATLALPDQAKRKEWNLAKGQSREFRSLITEEYGEEIWELQDVYFGLRAQEKYDEADAFLRANPDVPASLELQGKALLENPDSTYSRYYGSIWRIESYYESIKRGDIERELGAEIWDTLALRSTLATVASDAEKELAKAEGRKALSERKQFDALHPELDRLFEIQDDWAQRIARHVADYASYMDEDLPFLIRDDFEEQGVEAEKLAAGIGDLEQEFDDRKFKEQITRSIITVGGSALVEEIDSWLQFGSLGEELRESLMLVAERNGISFIELKDILRDAR